MLAAGAGAKGFGAAPVAVGAANGLLADGGAKGLGGAAGAPKGLLAAGWGAKGLGAAEEGGAKGFMLAACCCG